MKLEIHKIRNKRQQVKDIQDKLQSLIQQIKVQLQSLIQIYNDTHERTLTGSTINSIFQQILVSKPKHFSAKYYKTLPWDPDVQDSDQSFDEQQVQQFRKSL